MSVSEDIIKFNLIEGQKENIQALPGGRSVKKLLELYSPKPSDKLSASQPADRRSVEECIRAEYETELRNMSESDDPLDIFDRYVRWTLDAFPSAQATPQSQLHTLLERATKAFISSVQYKNDPRYLKLWMHYIHFFSDAPREAYVFLSRHGIGEGLALFYEEYAAWLESAERWAQAAEIYKLGIDREARPVQRLMRKSKEFEARRAQQPLEVSSPSSPALPMMRLALAAKTDPFSSSGQAPGAQQTRPASSAGDAATRPSKSKLTVFSDSDAQPSALAVRSEASRGWDTIDSLSHRKKENTMQPKPWVGETLKAGSRKAAAPKLAIFRDPSLLQINNIIISPSQNQVIRHPQTGRKESIFVNLEALYPSPEESGTELSFEEFVAANRGWLHRTWDVAIQPDIHLQEIEEISRDLVDKLVVHQDCALYDENGVAIESPREPRLVKKKMMEVNETQIIKAKLGSPSGPRVRKKNTAEPTMTLHTKVATEDIYEIFNAPLKSSNDDQEVAESADEDDYETDGNYTSDAESMATTRPLDTSQHGSDEISKVKNVSQRSPKSAMEHDSDDDDRNDREEKRGEEDISEQGESSDQEESLSVEGQRPGSEGGLSLPEADGDEEGSPPMTRSIFNPIAAENHDFPTRPFRDAAEAANNMLPFMTPITERTECSLDVDLERERQFKTLCRREDTVVQAERTLDLEPLSSPLRDISCDELSPPKVPAVSLAARHVVTARGVADRALPPKGPIIKDKQCNPVDETIRRDILNHARPPLSSYGGFHDHRDEKHEDSGEIRRFVKALSKPSKSVTDRAACVPEPMVIRFPDGEATYRVKKELGAGAFAPVFLVENSTSESEAGQDAGAIMGRGAFAVRHRTRLEALKIESPPSDWEFYMMRLAHARLGPQHRAAASLSYAHELQLYQDEAFLFLPYHAHGTLLDVVNLFRAEPSGVMDELLAIFLAVELLRTVEALHAVGVMHGDLKPDNCLLRLDPLDQPLAAQWRADGGGGWAARGLVLIDLGRGIDMRAFERDVEFVADWKTSAQDCAEMREGRPWTWQIDYHGLAGILHCLLFGKYMETARCDQGGLGRIGRRYRIRETFKRYWQTGLWNDCFEMLLNPASCLATEDAGRMPVLRSMRAVRERMECWLAANCDRGVGLRSLIGKLEVHHAKSRR